MLISSIKYLMAVTAGIIIGYLIFTEEVKQPISTSESFETKINGNIDPSSKNGLAESNRSKNNLLNETIELEQTNTPLGIDQNLITKLKTQIETQQQKILELENLLQQKNNIVSSAANPAENKDQNLNNQSIETLSMKDFEDKMKNQFLDRFKGYAIELDAERLEAVKAEFNKNSSKANWNADYENNINAFIQDNDLNRLHYVDELTCNSNMCRLKVNSSQPNNWRQLFLNMTQQSWYHSITLSENSGDPNIFIYFITQPQNQNIE